MVGARVLTRVLRAWPTRRGNRPRVLSAGSWLFPARIRRHVPRPAVRFRQGARRKPRAIAELGTSSRPRIGQAQHPHFVEARAGRPQRRFPQRPCGALTSVLPAPSSGPRSHGAPRKSAELPRLSPRVRVRVSEGAPNGPPSAFYSASGTTSRRVVTTTYRLKRVRPFSMRFTCKAGTTTSFCAEVHTGFF